MTFIKILESFELEINKLDDAVDKPSTDDSLYWLNQGVAKFVKQRFNGDFIHRTSFEQNDKRRMDLIHLFRSKDYYSSSMTYTDSDPSYDQYSITYPDDFMYSLNEDVIISDNNGGNRMNTFVFECTRDSFMSRVNNSLTDFHYRFHRARPIRIRFSNGCDLLTDKNYKIAKYTLGYLRTPNEITLDNPFAEYTDFEDIVMPEIIKIAAQMYIENKADQRYQTITNEVNTQE